jgi:hypothetical protein
MAQKTLSELRTFVQNKLDLRDEDFIDDAEILEYTEEAIKYCEAEIHKLNIEDQYFVAHGTIPLVAGRSDYALPTNVYGNKILRLVYSNGSVIRTIKRATRQLRFEDMEQESRFGSSQAGGYSYMLINNSQRGGTKLRFYPTPNETSSTYTETATVVDNSTTLQDLTTSSVQVGWFIESSTTGIEPGTRVASIDTSNAITMTAIGTIDGQRSITFTQPLLQIWYIRHAEIPEADTDYIDFPEFWHFIAQHVLVNCLKKELGNPRIVEEKETLKELRAQMIETLSNMVPDQDDEIEKDLSIYEDMGEV